MASTRRKSAAIALAVVGVAGLSLASAATLDITPGTLQAGTEDQAGCQGTTPVVVDFVSAWDAAADLYEVGDVALSGFAAGCATSQVEFTLIDDDGAALFSSTSTTATGTVTVDVSGSDVDAELVDGVAVVIH